MLRALFLLLLSTSAVAGWTPPVALDTGFFAPNTFGLVPVDNEPDAWSAPLAVPVPPPGATMVRVTRETVAYQVQLTITNTSPALASYGGSGWYDYRLAHRPGVYWYAGGLYLRGCAWDQAPAFAASINAVAAGGGGFTGCVAPGDTVTRSYLTTFQAPAVELLPATGAWWRSRQGAHPLYVTARGDYNWSWWWNNGVPPPGWSGHSPLHYTAEKLVRWTGTVEFYVP